MQQQQSKILQNNLTLYNHKMGGCLSAPRDPVNEILKKAYDTFQNIDVNKNNQINASDIEKHFGSYSLASAKIMMREIDLDKDNIITFNQWMGYWEMVRRAGYSQKQIIKQLNNINEGQLTLNFPQTYNYEQHQPRSTVVNSIVDDLKRTPPQKLPFKMQK